MHVPGMYVCMYLVCGSTGILQLVVAFRGDMPRPHGGGGHGGRYSGTIHGILQRGEAKQIGGSSGGKTERSQAAVRSIILPKGTVTAAATVNAVTVTDMATVTP